MTDIYKLATLNINGLASQTRLQISEELLWKQVIDIAFLSKLRTHTSTP